ncbi:MAG: SsrA-binding protein [Candidatus Taylorbacteria bacterium RIFCSPLOWO2_01_FULL_44_26]|uniref:SsrA-binding protein n=2 Tax=Candidatus Tayloriibacteriota TaxID=1817919 RepID=A0A1G2MMV4_9BACT|nr:MAG: SsrA-binding protein [Candidatus Taylorbacteria bacterium RIFCSPHIGHO2_02_FULL_44_12]OHA31085.1 MAG: SsrA-binding protein [Candidatus Taylorbacteria bacterium RIFCSPLOWO2_01_FULL_44_26]
MSILLDNKKAHLNYEVLETFEAGIELFGFEVKSLKNKQGSLDGAHVIIRGGEAYAIGILVPPYQQNNTPKDYESRRNRRLVLTKKEIARMADIESGRGLTIVPLSMYIKGDRIKISLASVRGKNKRDKRETIKRREVDRAIRREFRDR